MLAHCAQRLGGLIAAKSSLLKALNFEHDFGVHPGLLIDAHRASSRHAHHCKSHVVHRFRQDESQQGLDALWAVGDKVNDLEMLREEDRAFVIEPKPPSLVRDADATGLESFDQLALKAIP